MGVIYINKCQWHHDDCENEGNKCLMCIVDSQYYKPKVYKNYNIRKKAVKPDNRKGSGFEYKNHIKNKHLLEGSSTRMTPNSGAGHVKGDEEIVGLINIMEELKTQNRTLAKGDKTFSLRRSWLTKLHDEAVEANKEFWYMKISFGDDDECFVITEEDVIMSMVYTMHKDRQDKIKLEFEVDRLNKIIEESKDN